MTRKSGSATLWLEFSRAAETGGHTAGTAYTASRGGMEAPSEAQRQKLLKEVPIGRFVEAGEVAHAVRFLIHPLSGFIAGEIIDINGGLRLD